MTTMSYEELMKLAHADKRGLKGHHRFAAKLNFDQRCQILALEWMGFSRRQTARAYDVNRSTVNFIVSPSSPHYKDVRREFADLGKDAFIEKYITPEVLEHVKSFADDPEVELSNDELKAKRAAANRTPNANADKYAGDHRFRDSRFDRPYIATIEWRVFDDGRSGWLLYIPARWVDEMLDREGSSDFYFNTEGDSALTGEEPQLFATSKQAFDAWVKHHMAELV